jgi:hypothetical protein
MNAFGVGPKDGGLLPGRAVAGPGEDVAVDVERLLKSTMSGPSPHIRRFCDLPSCRCYSGLLARPF